MLKVNYFFPVFAEDDIEKYLKYFKSSPFYKNYSSSSFIFVCGINDVKNINILKKELESNAENKLITLDKPFSYNDAFYNAINYFNAEVVLLGDTKVNRIDVVFEKCMQKYDKKINVVHIVKKRAKFKNFIFRLLNYVYNFFVKLFTNKTDRLNIISLGLIDNNIIDILKTLPTKCCFLKNTKDLLGFETRTIYIPQNTQTYNLNFKKFTSSLGSFIISAGLSFLLSVVLILLNVFIKSNLIVYNIVGILLIFLCLSTMLITLPKHFFDIRNFETINGNFKVQEIEVKITKGIKEEITNSKNEIKQENISNKNNKEKNKLTKKNKQNKLEKQNNESLDKNTKDKIKNNKNRTITTPKKLREKEEKILKINNKKTTKK